MILKTNYINKNNYITISIAPSLQLESIITTITGRVNGEVIRFKFFDFEEACQKFKELEKTLKKEF